MTIRLPALAVAFAAFCVWLTVRIINRGERWAKWTLALVVGLPLLYVLSFGPACWLSSFHGQHRNVVSGIYQPLFQTQFWRTDSVSRPIGWYAGLYARKGSIITKTYDGRFQWTNWDP